MSVLGGYVKHSHLNTHDHDCIAGGGGLGFGNAGLGFRDAAEERPTDAFDSYREQRSGRYKSSLIKPPPTTFV